MRGKPPFSPTVTASVKPRWGAGSRDYRRQRGQLGAEFHKESKPVEEERGSRCSAHSMVEVPIKGSLLSRDVPRIENSIHSFVLEYGSSLTEVPERFPYIKNMMVKKSFTIPAFVGATSSGKIVKETHTCVEFNLKGPTCAKTQCLGTSSSLLARALWGKRELGKSLDNDLILSFSVK